MNWRKRLTQVELLQCQRAKHNLLCTRMDHLEQATMALRVFSLVLVEEDLEVQVEV
jgi:hypothetical protein